MGFCPNLQGLCFCSLRPCFQYVNIVMMKVLDGTPSGVDSLLLAEFLFGGGVGLGIHLLFKKIKWCMGDPFPGHLAQRPVDITSLRVSMGLFVTFSCLFALASHLGSFTTASKSLVTTPCHLSSRDSQLLAGAWSPFSLTFACFILFSVIILIFYSVLTLLTRSWG